MVGLVPLALLQIALANLATIQQFVMVWVHVYSQVHVYAMQTGLVLAVLFLNALEFWQTILLKSAVVKALALHRIFVLVNLVILVQFARHHHALAQLPIHQLFAMELAHACPLTIVFAQMDGLAQLVTFQNVTAFSPIQQWLATE